jgi:hypothetical protein
VIKEDYTIGLHLIGQYKINKMVILLSINY